MTNLGELSLYRTKVSNAGLARLANLSQLRDLDVRYSRVTAAGVKELRTRIPDVAVLFDNVSNRTSTRAADVTSVAGKGEDAAAAWLRSIGAQVRLRDGRAVGVSLDSTSITDRKSTRLNSSHFG